MIDKPHITQTSTQLAAVIRLTIRRGEIRNVMGPGLTELMTVLAEQGILPTGPWFTHHLRMDPEIFDFEICLPVATPVNAVGRVKPGELPASKVASCRGSSAGSGAMSFFRCGVAVPVSECRSWMRVPPR